MVDVQQLPPAGPRWALTLTSEERDALLTALDYARSYVSTGKLIVPEITRAAMDQIEQALAATLTYEGLRG